jgi:hypothetical protein
VRSSLAEVSHVYDVETDSDNLLCSFQADLDKVDVGVRLHELSYENDKLENWSLASMEPVIVDESAEEEIGEAANDDSDESSSDEKSDDGESDNGESIGA